MKQYGKCSKILNSSCLPQKPRLTGQAHIRLLLNIKQSDQGLPCLLFWQALVSSSFDNQQFLGGMEMEKCSKFLNIYCNKNNTKACCVPEQKHMSQYMRFLCLSKNLWSLVTWVFIYIHTKYGCRWRLRQKYRPLAWKEAFAHMIWDMYQHLMYWPIQGRRSKLIRVFCVCYSDKHFVNSNHN